MKIILSKQCLSLVGMLSGCGYHIEHRKNGFFGKRNQNGFVPHDGHWRFIVICAQMAKNRLHITDIKVDWLELQTALYEAKCFNASEMVRRNYADKGKANYDAADIINLKITFGL